MDATTKIWVESSASYTDIAATTGIIPAAQGFLVHVTAAGTVSLTIDATDQTHSSQNWCKEFETNTLRLVAVDPEGSTQQDNILKFGENHTEEFEPCCDSRFLSGYAPMLYSKTGEIPLSTNALPTLSEELQIPLSFVRNGSSNFYIQVEGMETLNPPYPLYLTDLKTSPTIQYTPSPHPKVTTPTAFSCTSKQWDKRSTPPFRFAYPCLELRPQVPYQ